MFVLVANPDRASGLGADRLATVARTMAGPIVLVTCAAWLELSALIRWNPSKAPVLGVERVRRGEEGDALER